MAESFKEILESGSYQDQKRVVNREANWGDPKDAYICDRTVFKKTDAERALLYTLRKEYESGNFYLTD